MIIILDVSAAIQIILKKEKMDFYKTVLKETSWVIAPDLYIPEITNVLWKYHSKKILNHEECQQYVEDGIFLIDDYFPAGEYWKEALGESIKSNHSVYDLFYAVLARRNDATLVTNDKELSEVCKKVKIDYKI